MSNTIRDDCPLPRLQYVLPNAGWLRGLRLVGLVSVAFLGAAWILAGAQAACRKASRPNRESAILNAIVLNSETVYFCDLRMLSDQIMSKSYFWAATSCMWSGIEELLGPSDRYLEHLEYAVIGAMHFRRPPDLGMTRSEQVQYLRLRKPLDGLLEGSTTAATYSELLGRPVWRWEVTESYDRAPGTFFLLEYSSRELLIATDLGLLRSVVNDLSSKRSAMRERPEWAEVDLSASFWAVRRYRLNEVVDPLAAGTLLTHTSFLSPNAVALTFYFDSSARRVVLRYVTRSESLEGFDESWRKMPGSLIESIRPGVWQISFQVDSEWVLNETQMLETLRLLGFGIFS